MWWVSRQGFGYCYPHSMSDGWGPQADPWGARNNPDPREGKQGSATGWEWGNSDPVTPASVQPMRFHRTNLIAQHGQGEVWRATLENSDRVYAIKILLEPNQNVKDIGSARRFEREVRAQSTLVHAGIMPVVTSNFSDSPPWFVMPIAERSLRDILREERDLSDDECVGIISQVAEALSYAHQNGVIHRDVKPENILWLNERWVLSDFGLCRDYGADSTTYTQADSVLGTLPYMAPEQWTDPHNVKAPADIFAIGRVFYEILTGKVPWPNVQMERVPDRFKYIITKCLNDSPKSRYPSVEAFLTDLQALTASQNDLALPIDHAQKLAERVAASDISATAELIHFVLGNLSDDIFLGGFLPSVTPPVLAAMQDRDQAAFTQIVRAFDKVCSGSHAFSWTDSAARLLERVFKISNDPATREMVLARILRLGTEHNRWAVRDIYVNLISGLTDAHDILMVAGQLSDYPRGAAFVREITDNLSLPRRIVEALAA